MGAQYAVHASRQLQKLQFGEFFVLTPAYRCRNHTAMMQNPLQRWMDDRRFEAKDVAARIGVSASSLSRMMRGLQKVDPETLSRIANVTGCSVTPNDWVAWDTELRRAGGQGAAPVKKKGRLRA